MRIPSGVTDQLIYFVAVDATDFTTRETGLTTFIVYRSRNGAAAAAMTTPTVAELDSTNMPGVYSLLLDEDMTIAAGNDSEEMVFHITQASMAPVTRTIELYRPKITAGETLVVASGAVGTVTTLTGHTAQTGDNFARLGAPAGVSVSADIATVDGNVDAILVDTGTTLDGKLDTIDANVDAILVDTAEIGAAGAGLTEAGGTGDHLSAVPWNAAWDAEVQSEVADALDAAVPVTPTADSINERIKALDDNYTAARAPNLDNLDATVSSRATQASVDTVPTAGENADAVLDEALSAHVTAGTLGKAVADIEVDTNELQTDDVPTLIAALPTAAENRAEMDSNSTQLAAIVQDTGTDIPAALTTIDTVVDRIEVDTQDIQSRLPAALVGGRMDSDVSAISTSTDAANKLEASTETIETGAAVAGTLSTTQMTTDLTEETDDHYIGRVIIWTSGVLLRQATVITDYAGATKLLTFTAVTEAPTAGDSFVIV